MAKRRKLEAPSSADLDRIEAQFRSETAESGRGRGLAPIAQVAAESAAQSHIASPEDRESRARTEADATRLREAVAEGRLIAEIPLADIDADAMIRDRTVLDSDALSELRQSIAASGLRLPIEVFAFDKPTAEGRKYGLLSGYRRFLAVRGLAELTGDAKYTSIKALVRSAGQADDAFAAMVEENEVRAELSHFERGRIAVIAAQQGAFANTEDAVNRLFSTGSKAKRSKVRSFALVFEELGDMLAFPESLTEKRGLRLAGALRMGAESRLRDALATRPAEDADEEWAVMEAVVTETEAGPRPTRRGGRPRNAPQPGWQDDATIRTSGGITIRRGTDSKGHILRIEGKGVDTELMDSLMLEIQALLERP